MHEIFAHLHSQTCQQLQSMNDRRVCFTSVTSFVGGSGRNSPIVPSLSGCLTRQHVRSVCSDEEVWTEDGRSCSYVKNTLFGCLYGKASRELMANSSCLLGENLRQLDSCTLICIQMLTAHIASRRGLTFHCAMLRILRRSLRLSFVTRSDERARILRNLRG